MTFIGKLGLALLVAGATVWSGEAKADCMTKLFTQGGFSNGVGLKYFKMTMARNDNRWVSTTFGELSLQSGIFTGTGNQYFSDRFTGNQFFTINSPDRQQFTVRNNGTVTIFNQTWGFTTNLAGFCLGDTLVASTGTTASDVTVVMSFDPTAHFRL